MESWIEVEASRGACRGPLSPLRDEMLLNLIVHRGLSLLPLPPARGSLRLSGNRFAAGACARVRARVLNSRER